MRPVRLAYKPYFFGQRIIFFSHNKSTNSTFSHGLSAKRIGHWVMAYTFVDNGLTFNPLNILAGARSSETTCSPCNGRGSSKWQVRSAGRQQNRSDARSSPETSSNVFRQDSSGRHIYSGGVLVGSTKPSSGTSTDLIKRNARQQWGGRVWGGFITTTKIFHNNFEVS